MKQRYRWAIGLVVVALIGTGVLRALSARNSQQQALAAASSTKDTSFVELAATDVVAAGLRDLVQGLAISGTLKAVDSATIKARVAGELQGLSVREGDFVQAGQVLARIESADYALRLRQAKEQAASSRAQVDVARRQFTNNQALVNQGFISRTALETSEANLLAAEATWRAAVAGSDVAAKSVEDTVLRAPISGQIAQRLAQTGERVGVDTRIVEVVDLRRLELEAAWPRKKARKCGLGRLRCFASRAVQPMYRRGSCASTPACRQAAAVCWCTWHSATRPQAFQEVRAARLQRHCFARACLRRAC